MFEQDEYSKSVIQPPHKRGDLLDTVKIFNTVKRLKSEMLAKMMKLLCIINRQNVVIKYYTRVWREYLQQK